MYKVFLISRVPSRVRLLRKAIDRSYLQQRIKLVHPVCPKRIAERIRLEEPDILIIDKEKVSAKQQMLLRMETDWEMKRIVLHRTASLPVGMTGSEDMPVYIYPAPEDRLEAEFLFDSILMLFEGGSSPETEEGCIAETSAYHTDKELAAAAVKIIRQNYRQNLTEQTLADRLYVSRTRLATAFKAYNNIAPHDYLMQVRMWKARSLLLNTDKQVKEIAAMTGYRKANYFTESFREVCRESPSSYRKSARRGK